MSLLGLLVGLCFAGNALFASQQSLHANPRNIKVVDGDSLHVNGVKVRLFGIDAPEIKQLCKDANRRDWACGEWARHQLSQLVSTGVHCRKVDTDRYGRTVAQCHAGSVDVAEHMVRIGAATAFEKYSRDYIGVEKEARARSVGFWSGKSLDPADYRKSQKTVKIQKPVKAACPIKGNISQSGRLYHLPGMRWYAKTQINTSKGERWFCSEAEAIAAGWRKARS